MESEARPSRWIVAGAFVATAVMLYFGTGLTPIGWLTWFAPLPALVLAPRVSLRTALLVAFGAYLVSTSNSWAYYAHSYDVPLPAGIGISIGYSVAFALGVWLFRAWVQRGWPLLAAFSVPAVWVALLYLTASVNPTGISGTLAGSQVGVPVVLQTAAVAGAWGVEFLLMLGPALLAALRFAPVRVAAVLLTFALAVGGYGVLRLSDDKAAPAQLVAAMVHDTAPWGVDITSPDGQTLFDQYAAAIAALPAEVTTVVLPEAAFGVDDASLPILRDKVSALATGRRTTVVVGYARSSDGRKYNESLAVPGDGGTPVSYLKHHDLTSVLGDDLVFVPSVPGANGGVGRSALVICGDVNFPDPARDYADAGATTLLIPAADNDEDGWQHAHTAVLRGVENGLAVVWAGRYGTAMIADGRGRVLAEEHVGEADAVTVVVAPVRPGSSDTPYTRIGDWAAWLAAAITVLAAGLLVLASVRRRAPVGPASAEPVREDARV
ncbi:apolipoprotein N-acyltransferase [Hamadaea flava]|uniref:Nitrilase-related carbon-nitrogen hydrolase n=1 Tax=Hamadaea flava TaxID=1742688 RepID=A0ABV8LQB3_9ACTN|nr:nitrilase-related carbon-nitrogen hydrolase [Hamadaea flava]MCP2322891.1 apolipoprotein N-acyltransferase [Hamadaea flava]